GGADPGGGYQSSQFASASRQYPDFQSSAIGGDAYSVSMFQEIDLSPYSSQIGAGDRYLGVSYAFFDIDGLDIGSIDYDYYDSGGALLSSGYSATTEAGGGWVFVEGSSQSPVPTSAATLRITLGAAPVNPSGFTGSARNVAFDAISASLLDPPAPDQVGDIVHGNLIQIDGDGNWTWYTDERSIVDPNNGHVLVNSVGFSPSYVPQTYTGIVDVVDFDPATGRRTRTQLSNQPGSLGIQSDDHNVGALLVLPDGRYLAMYANHGNNGGLGDEFTRYRISTNPGDSSSWTEEQTFNWYQNVPGASTHPGGTDNYANVSYHNLFYLADEDKVYDISRSYGLLSTNGSAQNMPNIVEFDPDTDTIQWRGQFLESEAQGYSAYPKYVSDGKSRIYFTTTETHPRNYNNSIFAGYIEGDQTFDMQGNLIDANVLDSNVTAGNGAVPDVTDFTLVAAPDPLGQGYNRFWSADAGLDSQGNLMALYTSRYNPDGATTSGTTPNPIDHRLHFARWDPGTQSWSRQEIARMGDRLFDSEEDYTGVGALIPGDENTLYISTDFDPRDPTWQTQTAKREIYRGHYDSGEWNWTAITEDSTVDNLRPIAPDTHGLGPQPVFWFRGDYFHAQNADTAVVGIIDHDPNEQAALVTYVDADSSNTTRAGGSPIGATGPSGGQGAADGLWHERTGFGNGGSVYTSNESGGEDAPALKTTIQGIPDGVYDVFAFFWSDNDEDWRLAAGLQADSLLDIRKVGAQSAEVEDFVAIEAVAANAGDLQLYRVYVGRADVAGGSDIEVFIDDWASAYNSSYRTWYDGVGYSLVSPLLRGDYNEDGIVDAADYTVWRDNLGATGLAAYESADGNGDGQITQADYEVWSNNYGSTRAQAADSSLSVPAPTAAAFSLIAMALTSLGCPGCSRPVA
ncbi:MAG: BNR-4 repeat-containing protein, partial [Planctomycetales bacterium]|nr:BNR-4 repeat-containing protein [Planctomycetales bacterium]